MAALMAMRGLKVVLLDLDVYAPSLQGYFHWNPNKWINDFLFETAEADEMLEDLTDVLKKFPGVDSNEVKGKTVSRLLQHLKRRNLSIGRGCKTGSLKGTAIAQIYHAERGDVAKSRRRLHNH